MAILGCLVLAMSATDVRARTWTDSTGKYSVEADFLELHNGSVRLKKPDGTTIMVPINRLSRADQEYVGSEGSKRTRPEAAQEPTSAAKVSPDAKSASRSVRFSDLKITKTTFSPPSVEFTIRLDLAGGSLLEAWASVGMKDAGEVLEVFAGALHQGLLAVNGIDFANPSPSLKAQRVSMKKGPDGATYQCVVSYPKLVLDHPETEFTIVAAVRNGDEIIKSNAATRHVNLKTGEVRN
jgi:hypothetical protein